MTDANLNGALQARADADRQKLIQGGVRFNGQSAADYLSDRSNKQIVDAYNGYEKALQHGQVQLVMPMMPPGMRGNADFGQNVMKWGRGSEEARARIETLTAEELEQKGVTQEMAKQWRDFCRQEAIRNPGNPSAPGRADLMQKAYDLLGGK